MLFADRSCIKQFLHKWFQVTSAIWCPDFYDLFLTSTPRSNSSAAACLCCGRHGHRVHAISRMHLALVLAVSNANSSCSHVLMC
jgi:hypothetical protein